MPNPAYAKVQKGAKLAKEEKVDFILAVGGGSVSDCCKIVASQAVIEEDIWEMEFGKHQFPTKALPMGVVVTASGTGSEQNNGAVITNEEKMIKTGVFGAFDTFSHAMETYFGKPQETFVSDEINEAIMRNIIRNIRKLVQNPKNMDTRRELMWDSAMAENGIVIMDRAWQLLMHLLSSFRKLVYRLLWEKWGLQTKRY